MVFIPSVKPLEYPGQIRATMVLKTLNVVKKTEKSPRFRIAMVWQPYTGSL